MPTSQVSLFPTLPDGSTESNQSSLFIPLVFVPVDRRREPGLDISYFPPSIVFGDILIRFQAKSGDWTNPLAFLSPLGPRRRSDSALFPGSAAWFFLSSISFLLTLSFEGI